MRYYQMTKQLKIREEQINFLDLIKMNLDRKHWGQKYVLFTSGSATVEIQMEKFNFKSNCAIFDIRTSFRYDDNSHDNWDDVYYYLDNYTPENFELTLYKTISRMLNRSKNRIITAQAQKEFASMYKSPYDSTLLEIPENAAQWEKIQALDIDEEIKDNLLDEFRDKIAERHNKAYDEAVTNYENTTILSAPDVDNLLRKLQDKLAKLTE